MVVSPSLGLRLPPGFPVAFDRRIPSFNLTSNEAGRNRLAVTPARYVLVI
jgi:hypothetical protein